MSKNLKEEKEIASIALCDTIIDLVYNSKNEKWAKGLSKIKLEKAIKARLFKIINNYINYMANEGLMVGFKSALDIAVTTAPFIEINAIKKDKKESAKIKQKMSAMAKNKIRDKVYNIYITILKEKSFLSLNKTQKAKLLKAEVYKHYKINDTRSVYNKSITTYKNWIKYFESEN